MPYINVEYDYNLPNEYLVDHNQDQGNARTTEYDGPDKIYLIVNNETNKEEHGPVTADDLADGRPLPMGCRYVEVDCTTNPLICQLRAPVIDEHEEDYTGETSHRLAPDVEGYFPFRYQTPLLPKDVYDKLNLDITSDNVVTPRIRSIAHCQFGQDRPDLTWDDVKKQRNYVLKSTDGVTSTDMPQALLDAWATYRQLLRDLPINLANIPPNFAIKMFPDNPHANDPTVGGQ